MSKEGENQLEKPKVDAEVVGNISQIERIGQAIFGPLAEAGAAQARAEAEVTKHAIDADKEIQLRYHSNVGDELARRHVRHIFLSLQVTAIVLPIIIAGIYLLVVKESPYGWSLITLIVGGTGGAGGGYYIGQKSASNALPAPPSTGDDGAQER